MIICSTMVYGQEHDGDYTNPILSSGADPWVIKHEGWYYYCSGVPGGIGVSRSRDLHKINPPVRIWKVPEKGQWNSTCVWAPELHYIDGVWYIYFTAGDAKDVWEIRPYLLMCEDKNPMTGKWIEKGRIDVGVESFSLDMTTFIHKGEQYVLWAQKTEPADVSDVYIAKMKNPWTLATKPMILTTPEYDWEVQGFKVNEGPAVLQKR